MIPRPWTLPLIVIGLLAPIALGLAVFGPQGMIVAAIVVGVALVIIVARPGGERPIEVAASDPGRHRALLSVHEPIDGPRLAERIAREVGRRADAGAGGEAEAHLVAPALNPRLAHWAADVADARAAAKARLDVSVDRLGRAGLPARGAVGDSNPTLAIEDALREVAADEVVVVADEESAGELVSELRRRLEIPVELAAPEPAEPGIAEGARG